MSGLETWIRALTQSETVVAGGEEVTGDELLRRWAAEDRETEAGTGMYAEPRWQQTGTDAAPAIRLTDAEIDRVAWALCRRLLDAAGNM